MISVGLFIVIAKHLKWGHQEDAHEFLRFLVDALVKSQLAGYERYGLADNSFCLKPAFILFYLHH